ncbi:PEP-CTERM sorting domain-containing protein [Chitinimonas sp. PSY-7]|uniref:PEP-CTERM sorting domain-containing protein n=1 Tax=Chitinimonas sp. PSY-7 TaxID=3459088 RepID=UPI00404019B8
MQFKQLVLALSLAGVAMIGSNAHALTIQDAWTLSAVGTTTTHVGHLGLNGGVTTVSQQVNASGSPFVGALFQEYGSIFSLNYVKENAVGLGDFGFPQTYAQPLDGFRFVFTGLSGSVSSYNAVTGAVNYTFAPGVGSIMLQATANNGSTWIDMAKLSMRGPSGGDLANFKGKSQTLGQSTIFVQFDSFMNGFGIDLDGPGLGYSSPTDLFMQLQTTNKISNPFKFSGACTFDTRLLCATGKVTSDGSADLFNAATLRVPEPNPVALIALGLVGVGLINRRRAIK